VTQKAEGLCDHDGSSHPQVQARTVKVGSRCFLWKRPEVVSLGQVLLAETSRFGSTGLVAAQGELGGRQSGEVGADVRQQASDAPLAPDLVKICIEKGLVSCHFMHSKSSSTESVSRWRLRSFALTREVPECRQRACTL
jgi:hypothetical protein